MHLVAAVYQPDDGAIKVNGMSVLGLDERGAQDAGIPMVYQERT